MFEIRRAELADAQRLSHVMSAAFLADPVSRWLIPDPDERTMRQPAFFRVYLEWALMWGEVYTTTNLEGIALWCLVDPSDQLDGTEDDKAFRDALGPAYDRFVALRKASEAVHPMNAPHYFLPFLAVVPERQNQGLGRLLLRHKLHGTQYPTYLEASNIRSRDLYDRLQFKQLPSRIMLPDDGPFMYPMWRRPT